MIDMMINLCNSGSGRKLLDDIVRSIKWQFNFMKAIEKYCVKFQAIKIISVIPEDLMMKLLFIENCRKVVPLKTIAK